MRSNAELTVLAAAFALAGCALGPDKAPPPATAGLPLTGDQAIPAQGYPDSRSGTTYAAPGVAPIPETPADVPTSADVPPPPMTPPRYDSVGYASWSDESGAIAATHRTLPPGTFVEVTSLDTGKTILVPVTGVASSSREIELSGAAAQELGLGPDSRGGVRVRAVNPGLDDVAALQAGRAPAARPDTPPVLLNPLRRKLAGTPGLRTAPLTPPTRPGIATMPRPKPDPHAAPSRPAVTTTAGYFVQVAALADAARARALARDLRGTVVAGGGLNRVRVGPFADQRRAQAARDDLARRGYGDGRIVRQD